MESPENPNHRSPPDDGWFFEAFDDFPFDDCFTCTDDQSTSDSTTVSDPSLEVSSPRTTLRRRRGIPDDDESNRSDKEEASSIASYVTQPGDPFSIGEKEPAVSPNSKEIEIWSDSEIVESSTSRDELESPPARNDEVIEDAKKEEEEEEESVSTAAVIELDTDRGAVASASASASPPGEVAVEPPSSSNLLEWIAVLVIKAIGFQLNLFLNFVSFPLWALYCSYMFVTDPFGVTRRGKVFLLHQLLSIWNSTFGSLSSWVNDWLKEHKTKWKLLLGVGWGLLLCVYVCIILCGLLVMAIMVSSFVMKCLVEEPLQIREELNFDYTQSKPVAFVPMISCAGVGCGVGCDDKVGEIRSFRQRVIPAKHKVEASVVMNLPESEYNRNLGMFQVRVEFLSADGRILASKSHPCMLKFKSEPIRILLTMFKVVPLVAGYISESQTLRLRIRGFTGADEPTSCLRVTIERRAEFSPGGGIPELYDASLTLESQLPFLRRIIWSWKKTIFVWISLVTFMMELLAALICCRPVILPRPRPRSSASPPPAVHDSSSPSKRS